MAGRGRGAAGPSRTCFDQLHQLQQLFRIAMKKPVIAHPSKALGQNMPQYELQKVLAGKGTIAGVAGLAFGILACAQRASRSERDLAVLIGHDVFFTDHAPV